MQRRRGEGSPQARAGLFATAFVLAVAAGDLTLYPLIQVRAGTLLPLVVAVSALWSARNARWRAPAPLALLMMVTVVAGSAVIALVRAPDPVEGRTEVQGLAAGLAIALTAVALSRGTSRGLAGLRRGWVLALGLAVLVGAVELITGRHLWIPPGLSWAETSRTIIAGAFRNPNDFALALTAMISGTLAFAASLPRWTLRHLGLALLVAAGVVGVVLTESRSGLLACALVAAVHAVGAWRRHRHVDGGHSPRLDARTAPRDPTRTAAAARSPRLLASVAAVAALAAVAATFLVPPLAARNPVVAMMTAAAQPGTARSDRLRIDLMRAAVRYYDRSDGMGTGAASFEVLLARDPAPGVASRTWLHNTFLELLLQYGAFATAALLALLGVVAFAVVRPRRAGPRAALVRVETLGALVPFVALGLASATVLTTPLWWLLLGQLVAGAWWLGTTPRPAPARPITERPASAPPSRWHPPGEASSRHAHPVSVSAR